MSATHENSRKIVGVLALAVAVVLGYFLAKLTSTTTAPPRANPAVAENDALPTRLDVPESHLAAVGIQLETVTQGNLGAEIQAPGTISAAPGAQASVTARVTGALVGIDKRLGDPVRAGEVLARVESREAAAIAADRDVAISKAELARSALKREQELFDQHVTPRQDLETARSLLTAAESEERRARSAAANAHVGPDGRSIQLVSPIGGYVTAMSAHLGAFVQPDTELFRVADPEHLQIEAPVTATDATHIVAGDPAVVISGSRGRMEATVHSVTAALNDQTRAATVVLTLSSTAGQKLPAPGEFVRVVITPRTSVPTGIVLSSAAVQRVEGRDIVFVRTADGFRIQPVVVAARGAGRALVTSGLKAGEQVAAQNAFFLKAELGKGAEEDEE